MTDDELDLLASAYADGEATPEEVALVEADPELLARVEIFRAVQVDEPITPPPGLAQRHLAAAMAEFEATTPSVGAAAPAAASAAATAGEGSRTEPAVVHSMEQARERRRSRFTTMPSWLPAAAVVVVIGGGLLWAVGQGAGGGDDSAEETASVAADSDTDDAGSDESTEAGEALRANSTEGAGDESEALMDEASEDSAMADEDASAAESAAAPAEAEEEDAMEEAEEEAADDAEADFFELAPTLFLDEIPDAETLDNLELPPTEDDIALSRCGFEVISRSLGEPVAFVPAQAVGQPAELFLFEDGDGTEIRLLVDGDCQVLEALP